MRTPLSNITLASALVGVLLFPTYSSAEETSTSSITICNYVNGTHQIYQMDSSGGNVQPIRSNTYRECEATISPDKTKIAFVSDQDGDPDVYIMDRDGTNLKNISNNDFIDYSPSWSENGDTLVYVTTKDGYNSSEINLQRISESQKTTIPNFNRSVKSASLSPDGQKVALVTTTNNTLAVMNVDGTGYTNFDEHQFGKYLHAHKPSWSKNGGKILFSYETVYGEFPGMEGDVMIATINPDGTNYREIYRGQQVLEIGAPVYSPDEQEITFIQSVPGENYLSDWNYTRQVFKINVDGTNTNQLTTTPLNVTEVTDWK